MPEQLSKLLDSIDQENQQDPNKLEISGQPTTKELIYGQRMTAQLHQFLSEPSTELQIACRAQHIKRWSIPRSDYPMDRSGYKKWRLQLGKFHGEFTAQLMQDCGYNEESQQRVCNLLQKKRLKVDADAQALEDVACLVFIEHHLEAFTTKHSREKLISIIQKTWNKMSDSGHQAALKLPLSEQILSLVSEALNA